MISKEPTKSKVEYPFKTVITDEAERKIRYTCTEIKTIEWSGILFYKVLGPGLVDATETTIEVIDLLLMDIGTGSTTEYDPTDLAVMEFLRKHPDYMNGDVYMGHIHSHHNMATFFSSTDKTELFTSAPLNDVFISLIVNNAGNYSVGFSSIWEITSKTQSTTKVKDWKGEEITRESESTSTNQVLVYGHKSLASESEILTTSGDEDFDKRLQELQEEKKKVVIPRYTPGAYRPKMSNPVYYPYSNPYTDYQEYNSNYIPAYLSEEDNNILTPYKEGLFKEVKKDYPQLTKGKINSYVGALVSGNLYNPSNTVWLAATNLPMSLDLQAFKERLPIWKEVVDDYYLGKLQTNEDALYVASCMALDVVRTYNGTKDDVIDIIAMELTSVIEEYEEFFQENLQEKAMQAFEKETLVGKNSKSKSTNRQNNRK